ncbi:MAG: hypothetical protein JW749_07505 [Sedimentisphaerales bacterium]|nr:hypothetical protein [Sedimentisphaerales bacterium]
MVRLCKDSDILRYEPALIGELHPTNQVLATGQGGELAGMTFEASAADFVSAEIEPGNVIYLRSADGVLDGIFEIAAVDSATQLCVSVLRGDSESDPTAPPVSGPVTDIFYRVSTLRPQIETVSLRLTEYFGIRPGRTESDYSAEDILNSDVICRVCAYGVIASAYATMESNAGEESFREKQLHYEQLFMKGKEGCRLSLDANGDNVADSIRFGGCGRLIRD